MVSTILYYLLAGTDDTEMPSWWEEWSPEAREIVDDVVWAGGGGDGLWWQADLC
jgi:hypothetical protein